MMEKKMMCLTMDRKTYIRDVYSKYWITAREKIYGFTEYDKNLCNYLCEYVPNGGKVLEVAIGTGYPFGDFFQKAGYLTYGIDISPALIEKCQQINPNIKSKVGDAEDLDYLDNYFDCTYCFHSTWYFPDLNKAIDEMLRVTRPGGLVMFDIQNRNNKEIDSCYQKQLSESKGLRRIIRYGKNIVARVILHHGTPIWCSVIHEVPTYPESIYRHLKDRQVTNFKVMVEKNDESIEVKDGYDSFKDYGRLVFVVRK